MKLSREARIGILVAISVLVFFAGFWFLKGSNIFSGENEFYAYYESVQGLQLSAAVQVKGVNVGKVNDIILEREGDSVKVVMGISKTIKLPKGTIARMVSLDLLGTKAIRLEPGTGYEYYQDNETIPTAMETGVIDNISHELSPLIADVRNVVGVLDSVLTGIDNMFNAQTRENLTGAVSSLNLTMQNFSELSQRLNREGGQLASAIRNLNSITDNLARNNESIDRIIDNASSVSDQLKNAPIDKLLSELNRTASELNLLLDKVNRGEGSLGLAVNDKQLYHDLTATLSTLKSLLADIQSRPSRYINVTIFGRKNRQ